MLASYLRSLGLEVVCTREPGGTPVGEETRKILGDRRHQSLLPMAELFLFEASRVQHLEEVILPALERTAIVLCDRYTHSTLAYQGFGRGIPLQTLEYMNRLATKGIEPHLTILLDLDPSEGLGRVFGKSKRERNRLDEESLEFYQRVRKGYLFLSKKYPDTIKVVSASSSPRMVQEEMRRIVTRLLRRRKRLPA